MTKQGILLLIALFITAISNGQADLKDWYHKSYGVSVDKTYTDLLKDRAGQEVIVAIIDSGVDIEHEDLYANVWVNADEIPGNGIDDDKNGYIDDIHGWNFIGGPDGSHVGPETYEATRLYAKLRTKYEKIDSASLKGKELEEYNRYKTFKEEVERKRKQAESQVQQFEPLVGTVMSALEAISGELPSDTITPASVADIPGSDQMINIGKSILSQIFKDEKADTMIFSELKQVIDLELTGELANLRKDLDYHYNPDYDSRKEIVKDNYDDGKERIYGNNDVEGPDPLHGTHVAGIVGAIRNNDIGMNGVAPHVKIMSIRTVPDGDERDKDVANAIRYAVDNGASIINMSFGKGHSWDKEIVDDAVKYADKKDVLMVHAAGNSSQNNDTSMNFPNDTYDKGVGFLFWKRKNPKSWIEVGALSHAMEGKEVSGFSNYGAEEVDVFAPGDQIYSTMPNDNYAYLQGTSMASPVVAGAAAVLRSYFPKLKASQVKEIIMESSRKLDIEVTKPGTSERVPFSTLSKSGGVIDLYQAFLLASKTKGKKKLKKNKKKDTGA